MTNNYIHTSHVLKIYSKMCGSKITALRSLTSRSGSVYGYFSSPTHNGHTVKYSNNCISVKSYKMKFQLRGMGQCTEYRKQEISHRSAKTQGKAPPSLSPALLIDGA